MLRRNLFAVAGSRTDDPAGDRSRKARSASASPGAAHLIVLVLSVLASQPLAAQLSPVEARAVSFIEEHAEEAIDLLARTVEINSGTMNMEGVRRVHDELAPEFEALGFSVRWAALPDSLNRAGHLVAERIGPRGKRLLLIGHLDTVFEDDDPFRGFVREGRIARGPGVADMKGGNVVLLYALKALHDAGALDGATLRVVLTGDEESPGRPLSVAREALLDAARESDIALGFEGGSRSEETQYAVVARRSSSGWMLEVQGRSAHSSGIFGESVGAGAIFEAARILEAFYSQVRGEEYLTFNPGVIVGGTDVSYEAGQNRGRAFGKTNVVAQSAVVHGGIRTISDEQLEDARDRMRRVVEENLPQTDARITFTDGYPAMPPTEGNLRLLERFDRVSRDLGLGPIEPFDPGGRGAADISFVASYVDALDGLGPYGSGSHTDREQVDLDSLSTAAKRAAVLIHRLIQEEAS